MRKQMQKVVAIILVLVLCLSAFVGCGENVELIDGHEKVTIKWMHHFTEPARIQWVKDVVAKTQELYPWITVDVEVQPFDKYKTTVKMKIQGDDAPDLFDVSTRADILDFVKNDYCADLTNEDFMDTLMDAGKGAGKVDGKYYTVVQDLGGAIVFYNKDMFAKYNLEVPYTYSEWMNVLNTLKNAGVTALAQGFQESWVFAIDSYTDYMPLMYENDANWALDKQAKKTKFSTDENFKMWAEKFWTRSQYAQKDRFGTDWTKACNLVASEKAAMVIGGFFALDAVQLVNPNINLGAFAMPINENKEDTKTPLGNAGGFVVFNGKTEAKVDASKKLLSVIISKEMASQFQTLAKTISTVKGISGDLNPALQDIVEIEADGRTVSSGEIVTFSGEYNTAWTNAVMNFLREDKCNVDALAKTLDDAFAKIS